MHLGVWLVAFVAGCGRVGFDAAPDPAVDAGADAPLAVEDLPCNTPQVIATLPDLTPDVDGAGWIAAAASPRGLVVAFSSGGVKSFEIDLSVSTARAWAHGRSRRSVQRQPSRRGVGLADRRRVGRGWSGH